MAGKVSGDDLEEFVFSRTGAPDDDVLVGPGYGEDAAALQVGEQTLVASSDPITFAADRIGSLAVTVGTNDVAACGATPRWILPSLFVPDEDNDDNGGSKEALDRIVTHLDRAAHEAGVAIVGGHAEFTDRERPLVSTTCLGLADRYIPTSGVEPGNEIVLTKSAAIEGGAILATDFEEALADDVPDELLDDASTGFADTSVISEAAVVREHATAMHDPTEGGVLAGAIEMAVASGVSIALRRADVPTREAVEAVCEASGIDPLRTFGSGALLAAVTAGEGEAAVADCERAGIAAAVIGEADEADGDPPGVRLNGTAFERVVRDDLYDLWE